MKRKIKEALFIQKLKPNLNVQEKSYKLFFPLIDNLVLQFQPWWA